MIIDRTFNQKNQLLTISYADKLGNRKYYQKYLHHIPTYEYDDKGTFVTWDNKKCSKVYKDTLTYKPNEFDILEYIYNLPKDVTDNFRLINSPKLYTFDIETEVSNKFPDPSIAAQKVTSIALVAPDLSCIVYGLHEYTEEQRATLEQRYLDFIYNNHFANNIIKTKFNDKKPRILYQYFATEEELLQHWYKIIIPKIPVLAGWNSYSFDFLYLNTRYEKLFGKWELLNVLRKASVTNEIGQIKWDEKNKNAIDRTMAPKHTAWIDYMRLTEQYDYSLRPYESYSLDWVAKRAVDANKIKYTGTLQQLYERDHEWYYYYNAVDALLVMLIHYKIKCLESPCAVSAITYVPLQGAIGKIPMVTSAIFEEFYSDGKHVVYDYDAVERIKKEYEGAFCGCIPGRYEYNVCGDFASLYPSQIQTCNISFENIVYKTVGPDSLGRYIKQPWSEDELENFRKDPNYFVTVMGTVYKNDIDYAFKRMQRKTKALRDKYKYLGQKIEAELITKIDELIEQKLKK